MMTSNMDFINMLETKLVYNMFRYLETKRRENLKKYTIDTHIVIFVIYTRIMTRWYIVI